ncbi:SRPBCC family protein [Kribbella capetownensis]|uniref:SRPBCC family protein n=1 Tax=Kribbella capetownensis TaxID=1572659 RepID=UPI00192DA64E|nr:SRPBCC family protein [Kribbella capetownensis]
MRERMIEVSRMVAATPETVFGFLVRPDNHHLLDTSGMVQGSADHVTLTELGQVFTMNMHNAFKGDHTVENHVVVFEPHRAIGWAPASPGDPPAGHVWLWRMAPAGSGSLVTHVYDWRKFTHLDMIDKLPVIGPDGLQESLDRLALAVSG